jgi:hypothetical protein
VFRGSRSPRLKGESGLSQSVIYWLAASTIPTALAARAVLDTFATAPAASTLAALAVLASITAAAPACIRSNRRIKTVTRF